MEIKNTLARVVDPYAQARIEGNEKDARKETAKAAPAAGDRISLSPEALLRTAAHSAVTQAPDVRREKVDAIKEKVVSGQYTVDSKNIAAKLLADEGALAKSIG